MHLGAGAIGNVDGGGEPLQSTRTLEQHRCVARHRRRDLGGDDEAASGEALAQPVLLYLHAPPF